jgi:hypothetical protein
MTDLEAFKLLFARSEELIAQLDKEQIADIARVLALHIADYQQHFGILARPAVLDIVHKETLGDEEYAQMLRGTEILVAHLEQKNGPIGDAGVDACRAVQNACSAFRLLQRSGCLESRGAPGSRRMGLSRPDRRRWRSDVFGQ